MFIKNDRAGFTLVEVLTVIAIVGVLSAIAIPSYISLLPNMRLKASARDLYSNMQKAKMAAIKRNKSVAITFNCAALTYTVFADDGSGGGTVNDNVQNGSEPTLVSGDMSSGVTGCSAAFGGTTPPIASFTPQGLPRNPGSVTLSNLSRTYIVTVTNAGAIRL